MSGNIKNYYTSAHNANGYVNLIDSNINYLDNIYILKGSLGTNKSEIIQRLGDYIVDQDYDIEFINCPLCMGRVDGVIVPELSLAVVDGTSPHEINKIDYKNSTCIHLDWAIDYNLLNEYLDDIENINNEIEKAYENYYEKYSEAKEVHDELEEIYISHFSVDKANEIISTAINSILNKTKLNKKSRVYKRLFGATTPDGPFNFVPELIENITYRYYIKGRAGSGKSTLMKKVAREAINRGIDVEYYYCSADSNSIDMLIFPEIDTCIFDATPPHEYFPERGTDTVIDMYSGAIMANTDELCKREIVEATFKYKSLINEAVEYLKDIKSLYNELENYYYETVNKSVLEKIYDTLLTEIDLLIKNNKGDC